MKNKIYTLLSIFLLIFSLVLLRLYWLSFQKSFDMPVNPSFSFSARIKFSTMNSTKRFFLDGIDQFVGKIYFLTLSNDLIKQKLNESNIQYYELTVPSSSFDRLNQNLPYSGRDYQPAQLLSNNSLVDVEIRYHGDSDYHWAYNKKSYRVNISTGKNLILINPKHSSIVSNLAGYWLASKLDLIAPDTDFVGVFINNNFNGIYLQVEKLDNDFLTKRNLDGSILRGENIMTSDIPDSMLFDNSATWAVSAGNGNKNDILPLLETIKDSSHGLNQKIDYQYASKVLAYYSFIESIHLDRQHNWNLNLNNEKYYPIIWDSAAWVLSAIGGNRIDEANSDLTRKLRKDPEFNDLFYDELWKIANSYDQYLPQYLEQQWDRIYPILDFDFFKGGAWPEYNLGGPRKRQTTQEVKVAFQNLLIKIKNRADFIKKELSSGQIEYFVNEDTNNLYVSYLGVSHAILSGVTIDNTNYDPNKVSILNKGALVETPSRSGQFELISGKIVDLDNYSATYYNSCPTLFKVDLPIFLKDDSSIQISVTNKLTGNKLPVERVNSMPYSDCLMDISNQTVDNKTIAEPAVSLITENKLSEINIDVSQKRIDELISGEDQDKKINLKIDEQEFNGKLEMAENSAGCLNNQNNFSLTLDTPYLGKTNYLLKSFSCENYFQTEIALNLARQLTLLSPQSRIVSLKFKGEDLRTYYLIDKLNKAFFETQKRTSDTEVYEKIGDDSLNLDSWKKFCSDPRLNENNSEPLKQMLTLMNTDPEIAINYFDEVNLINFYIYFKSTGVTDPKYLLYFNNTIGKFEFVPNNYKIRILDINQEFADELLDKLTQTFKFKRLISQIDINQVINTHLLDTHIKSLLSTLPTLSIENNMIVSKQLLGQQQKIIYHNLNVLDEVNLNTNSPVESLNIDTTKSDFLNNNSMFESGLSNNIILKSGEYKIEQTIVIPAGLKLTIEPGTKLVFSTQTSLMSYSPIIAVGTTDRPIEFVPKDTGQPWGVVGVLGDYANGSIFGNCAFSGGFEDYIRNIYLSGMLSVYHANDVIVRNCSFKNAHANDAVNFKYSNSSIYDSLFENNSADAIDFDYMEGEIKGNVFINNGNDAVDTSGSLTLIANNYIENSEDKCLSFGEESYTTAVNNMLFGCNIGIEVKDNSNPILSNNVFYKNKTGINAYQKKEFFGPSFPKISNSIFIENESNLALINTFTGEKFDTDNSVISVSDSAFDSFKTVDKENESQNQEVPDLLDQVKNSGWSLKRGQGFIGLLDNDILPRLP